MGEVVSADADAQSVVVALDGVDVAVAWPSSSAPVTVGATGVLLQEGRRLVLFGCLTGGAV